MFNSKRFQLSAAHPFPSRQHLHQFFAGLDSPLREEADAINLVIHRHPQSHHIGVACVVQEPANVAKEAPVNVVLCVLQESQCWDQGCSSVQL